MSDSWQHCKHILCVRADNMGDVIMSGPAMRALKETFGCRITLLTSGAAKGITTCIKEIDDVIIADLPWVKHNASFSADSCAALVKKIHDGRFDGAIIFTVYSQSALPAALLLFMAGVPLRLAYCRENPYELLTDWVPDKEPYDFILHQVERDLRLVQQVGASTTQQALQLYYSQQAAASMLQKLQAAGVNTSMPWILLHPGVSEAKRSYPPEHWMDIARLLHSAGAIQLLVSGTAAEAALAHTIAGGTGIDLIYITAGLLDVPEFIACIAKSQAVVTVNTATVHIAAAVQTPQVVLYAATNPQHTPWQSPATVLYFPVQPGLESKNEVIQYVNRHWKVETTDYPSPVEVVQAVAALRHDSAENLRPVVTRGHPV